MTVGAAEKKLQRAILYYAERRDERLLLNKDEVEAKDMLMKLMEETDHKPGDAYSFNDGGIVHKCELVIGKLSPKVTSEEG